MGNGNAQHRYPFRSSSFRFFLQWEMLCLRECQEHRELQLSQLERSKNPDKYVYSENSSKN